MRFEKGQMPPVKGFWSLTMYDPDFFFVPNPIDRYCLSQRDTFVTNDGRVGRPVSPGRVARPGQGGELAAGAQGQVHPDAPALLAGGHAALDPGWIVDAAPGETRAVTGFWLLPWLRGIKAYVLASR